MPIEGEHSGRVVRYPKLFKSYATRRGHDWLRRVDPENRKVFAELGYRACGCLRGFEYLPKTGGTMRALTAERNRRGQFKKTKTSKTLKVLKTSRR